MSNKFRKFPLVLITIFLTILICLSACTTSVPTPQPDLTNTLSELQFGTHSTVRIEPGQAKGFLINDGGPILQVNSYIEFKNNVPYSVDVYVVCEMYPGCIPDANSIEDCIKDSYKDISGRSGEILIGMPFKNNPYFVWFVNSTSNTDFEVEFIYDWKYPGTKEGKHIE